MMALAQGSLNFDDLMPDKRYAVTYQLPGGVHVTAVGSFLKFSPRCSPLVIVLNDGDDGEVKIGARQTVFIRAVKDE